MGILPIFMAFGLLGNSTINNQNNSNLINTGYSIYNESIYFHNMSYTMTTLFATYHGDEISSFMNSINEFETPLSQFYIVCFTILFAMAVYNFFTSSLRLVWDEIKDKKKNKLLK